MVPRLLTVTQPNKRTIYLLKELTQTHHGIEVLLQLLLLLLQEQTTSSTFPLAVSAPRGEETRQQHH